MAEVVYALKDVLARTKANQKAFSELYQGTPSGERIWRGCWPMTRARWRSSMT